MGEVRARMRGPCWPPNVAVHAAGLWDGWVVGWGAGASPHAKGGRGQDGGVPPSRAASPIPAGQAPHPEASWEASRDGSAILPPQQAGCKAQAWGGWGPSGQGAVQGCQTGAARRGGHASRDAIAALPVTPRPWPRGCGERRAAGVVGWQPPQGHAMTHPLTPSRQRHQGAPRPPTPQFGPESACKSDRRGREVAGWRQGAGGHGHALVHHSPWAATREHASRAAIRRVLFILADFWGEWGAQSGERAMRNPPPPAALAAAGDQRDQGQRKEQTGAPGAHLGTQGPRVPLPGSLNPGSAGARGQGGSRGCGRPGAQHLVSATRCMISISPLQYAMHQSIQAKACPPLPPAHTACLPMTSHEADSAAPTGSRRRKRRPPQATPPSSTHAAALAAVQPASRCPRSRPDSAPS